MPDSIQALLDAFPEGVVQMRGGLVLAANEKARQYLPGLTPGEPFPAAVSLPEPGETAAGSFVSDGVSYMYSCKDSGAEQMLLLRPGAAGALEGWQLEGALRQLRELLGDILAEAEAAGRTSAVFNKTFHRLFRLVGNLELMQQAAETGGLPFYPELVNLDDLYQNVVSQARDLLRESGITLEYVCDARGRPPLVSGDRRLLEKLLLGLISNAARAAETGTVAVTLRFRGDQARIMVSGGAADERRLAALLQGGPGEGIPLPGQGAGLGLSIARHIVRLHGGTMLPYGGGAVPGVLVSLPTGPAVGQTSVRTPLVERSGGLNPVLVELSDVLPAFIFGIEGLD